MNRNSADIILKNANIFTARDVDEKHTAIAIKADRIIHVGSDEDMMKLAHDKTKVYNLEGKTVLPGFCT